MKQILLSIIAIFVMASSVNAQCGDELMKQALGAMGNYQYIKDFDIKLAAGTSKTGSKFSVVLNSRTHYQVNIANGSANSENVVVEIYDGDKLITEIKEQTPNFQPYSRCTDFGASVVLLYG